MSCPAVLIVAFNRPETARRVFAAVRAARPARLFFACDAPRSDRPGEAERVAEVRAILQGVDWPCEVRTKFPESNLGCGPGVSSAISWFLGEAGEGIILEDDCLPDASFFDYCTSMLDRFRGDQRVGQVCGFNLLPEASPLSSDYFPSHFGWCWGWATWRRAWKSFDPSMEGWNRLKRLGLHRQHPFYRERVRVFDLESNLGLANTWDYQWHYALASQGMLSLVPSVNLVRNIGFTADATHTVDPDPFRSRSAAALVVNSHLRHPEFMLANPAYEQALIRAAHPGPWRRWVVPKFRRLMAKVLPCQP